MLGPVLPIIYLHLVFFLQQSRQTFLAKTWYDDDIENMFITHEMYGFNYIELYILIDQSQKSKILNQT